MGDVRTRLPILREYKEKGRVRYIGVTNTFECRLPDTAMRKRMIELVESLPAA